MKISRQQYEENIEKTFRFIKQFIEENGYAPVYREIIEGTGFKSLDTINNHLYKLKEEGKIDFVPEKARTIRIK